MNHILEISWIKQKTCWTLIHQRCNRPARIHHEPVCVAFNCEGQLRGTHPLTAAGVAPASHLRSAAWEAVDGLPLTPPSVTVLECCCPPGQAARRLKIGLPALIGCLGMFFFVPLRFRVPYKSIQGSFLRLLPSSTHPAEMKKKKKSR